jgi:hypothetical protein
LNEVDGVGVVVGGAAVVGGAVGGDVLAGVVGGAAVVGAAAVVLLLLDLEVEPHAARSGTSISAPTTKIHRDRRVFIDQPPSSLWEYFIALQRIFGNWHAFFY